MKVPAGISAQATAASTRRAAQSPAVPEAFSGAHLTRTRMALTLGALTLLALLSAIVAATFGSVHISLVRALSEPLSPDHAIFVSARLPRVLMGAAVGAALAAVGAALQALVRNPLAEGGILGISGGGAFGAIVALVFVAGRAGAALQALVRNPLAEGGILGISGGGAFGAIVALVFVAGRAGAVATVPLCAFGAALLSTVVVYRLAVVDGRLEPFTLLLVGVIFNSIWGAAIMLLNSVVNYYYVHDIVFWLMGSLEAPTYGEVAMVTVLGVGGFAVLMAHARDLNLLSLGDEAAGELGVDVDPMRRLIFVATSVMIAAAVSVSGIISFVGLIVPHMLRLAFGADHRLLLPASFLGGAAFLVLADLLARVAISPTELPVGAITALCGGPFFIYMLRREGRGPLAL
jgi:iron complex transport system permease protein